VEPELGGQASATMPVDLHIGDSSLSGLIESVHGGRLVFFRCAKMKAKDRLRAWAFHLAKCAEEKKSATESLLIAEDESVVFSPVNNAVELLANLLEIYRRGLCEPVPFFPESAFAYADAKANPSQKSTTQPIQKAVGKWLSAYQYKGEADDPYCAFCYDGKDPLDEEFESLAMEIFEPMLRNETQKT
jgi:exodeoxyribonuclease V gamma subunit